MSIGQFEGKLAYCTYIWKSKGCIYCPHSIPSYNSGQSQEPAGVANREVPHYTHKSRDIGLEIAGCWATAMKAVGHHNNL